MRNSSIRLPLAGIRALGFQLEGEDLAFLSESCRHGITPIKFSTLGGALSLIRKRNTVVNSVFGDVWQW